MEQPEAQGTIVNETNSNLSVHVALIEEHGGKNKNFKIKAFVALSVLIVLIGVVIVMIISNSEVPTAGNKESVIESGMETTETAGTETETAGTETETAGTETETTGTEKETERTETKTAAAKLAYIDECRSNPCDEGTCVDQVNGYICFCNAGYTGVLCAEDIDECQSNPCDEGTCADQVNKYNCTCNAGYTGVLCAEDIDECQSNSCDHGTCVDQENGYVCTCNAGYTGVFCTEDIDECQSNPCDKGTCVDQVNSYKCNCNFSYAAPTCSSKCNTPLGLQSREIPNENMIASTEYNDHHAAHEARLHNQAHGLFSGVWTPRFHKDWNGRYPATIVPNAWIQVRFIKMTIVTGIQTQGKSRVHDNYIKSYKVSYSSNGADFTFFNNVI